MTLAKELLQAQLAAPPSLEELAAAVNLSPFHFARVFRRATGMPPHTWLMQQRIARARALLQDGCLPLEVATQLGFADQSHLSRQFKQVYGVGPGAYRSALEWPWTNDRSLRRALVHGVYRDTCQEHADRLRSFDLGYSPVAMPRAGSLIHSLHEPAYSAPNG